MSKYLTHGMQLVYLDQCVMSRLTERPRNEPWAEMRSALFAAYARRRILCPNSIEHLVETAAMHDDDALEVDRILRALSGGWCLADEVRLVARQIFCAIKGTRMSRGHFLVKKFLNPLTHPGALHAMRTMKTKMDAHNEWLMQGVNEMNALVRDGKKGNGKARQIIIDLTLEGFAKRLRESISDAVANRRVEIFPDRYRATLRDWPSTILYTLAKEHRFRPATFAELYKRLVAEGVGFIPTLRIKGELQAFQFSLHAQMDPRDQYDITRISCALPYADIFVTDGEKAYAIRELGLDREFGVEVFSTKQKERAALLNRFRELTA